MSTTEIECVLQHIHTSLTAPEMKVVQQQLEPLINDLIQHHFDRLVQLLYRIDVNEKKLKQLLNDHPQTDAAVIISQLIIERQLQKLQTKRQFNSNDTIASEDKW